MPNRLLQRLRMLMQRLRPWQEHDRDIPDDTRAEFSLMVAACFPEFEYFAESPYHSCVGSHSSLEQKRSLEFFTPAEVALKIAGHGKAEPGNNIVKRGCNLLQVYHVAFGKHAAAPGNAGRVFRQQCQVAEFVFDGYPYSFGLLIEE